MSLVLFRIQNVSASKKVSETLFESKENRLSVLEFVPELFDIPNRRTVTPEKADTGLVPFDNQGYLYYSSDSVKKRRMCCRLVMLIV
jgi:hypothetical protein